ncbi:MAG: hypothetical protein SVX38_13065 [Chloroflexota bacterium]|nr:hypothetical protein [Chloroflexota bacterium]
MKCTICRGPLSRVRTPQGKLNRPPDSREVWRCLVCGADFAMEQAEQNERSIRGTHIPCGSQVWLRVA